MDEAQRLCDRVAVIDHGKVIALGSPSELIEQIGGEHVIEFGLQADNGQPAELDVEALERLPSVSAARDEGDGYSMTVSKPHIALPALIGKLQTDDFVLARLSTRHVSLEDVFVTLTGRHLRDDEVSSG